VWWWSPKVREFVELRSLLELVTHTLRALCTIGAHLLSCGGCTADALRKKREFVESRSRIEFVGHILRVLGVRGGTYFEW